MAVSTRRADAQRNIAAILTAAAECLGRDPSASTSEIAKAAGVGRVTLYGHFPSRAELVDAVFVQAIATGEETLGQVDLTILVVAFRDGNVTGAVGSAAQAAPMTAELKPYVDLVLQRVNAALQ